MVVIAAVATAWVFLLSWTFGTFTNKHARDLSYRFRPIHDPHWRECYARAQEELNCLTFGVFGENEDDQILYILKRVLSEGGSASGVCHEVSAILYSNKDPVSRHIATRHFREWHTGTFVNRSLVASDKLPSSQRDMFT